MSQFFLLLADAAGTSTTTEVPYFMERLEVELADTDHDIDLARTVKNVSLQDDNTIELTQSMYAVQMQADNEAET